MVGLDWCRYHGASTSMFKTRVSNLTSFRLATFAAKDPSRRVRRTSERLNLTW
jgi:hypothetical protein